MLRWCLVGKEGETSSILVLAQLALLYFPLSPLSSLILATNTRLYRSVSLHHYYLPRSVRPSNAASHNSRNSGPLENKRIFNATSEQ